MEDASYYSLLKFLLPRIPAMTLAGVRNSLYLSPTSSKWDLRTELQVAVLRSMMSSGSSSPSSLGKTQKMTLRDPGVKGEVWAAKATVPKPSDEGTREAIFRAIEAMGTGKEEYTRPENVDVRCEWIGARTGVKADAVMPDVTEGEKYKLLMDDKARKSKTTVLYLHGGAYYMCGFGTHRANVARLAKSCAGRAFFVEYRLAPQAAFPAQLLDAFNAYLYLLYPPEGALHEPVPAGDIVFAGDSAGGNLSFALLQLLLQLHREQNVQDQDPTVRYNGKDVKVPLPAGVTAQSGWFDITRSMPSIEDDRYDYLPPANHDDSVSKFPSDDIWPTTPPRGDVFCDLSLICHPLVSPVAAKSWAGSPPLWIMTGEELLTDEDKIVASQAAAQGVTVQWEQYEAMPHCFAMLMPHLKTSTRCYDSWGDFCRRCVEGEVKTSGTWIAAASGQEKPVDVKTVTDLKFDDVLARMQDAKRRRDIGWEKEGKALPKPAL